MEIYLLFIFITFTTIQIICAGVNTTLFNDDNISELSSSELRNLSRSYKKRLETQNRKLGYVSFDCSMQAIRADYQTFWPSCWSSENVRYFINSIKTPSLDSKIESLVESFEEAEEPFDYLIQGRDGAASKIPYILKFILGCLTRCYEPAYIEYLKPGGVVQARFLRKFVLDLNGLTENDDETVKYLAFVDFALSYAKLRHGTYGYDRIFANQIRRASSNENAYLPRIMHDLNLLSAWNFSEKDIEYINGLRSTYFIPPRSEILKTYYKFESEISTGQKRNISGILPYIDLDFCPELSIEFKVNS